MRIKLLVLLATLLGGVTAAPLDAVAERWGMQQVNSPGQPGYVGRVTNRPAGFRPQRAASRASRFNAKIVANRNLQVHINRRNVPAAMTELAVIHANGGSVTGWLWGSWLSFTLRLTGRRTEAAQVSALKRFN